MSEDLSTTNNTSSPEPGSPAPKPRLADESLREGVTDLVELARAAYKEKRQKDCWALVNAILKIDPDRNDARVVQSLIQSDLNRDFQRDMLSFRIPG